MRKDSFFEKHLEPKKKESWNLLFFKIKFYKIVEIHFVTSNMKQLVFLQKFFTVLFVIFGDENIPCALLVLDLELRIHLERQLAIFECPEISQGLLYDRTPEAFMTSRAACVTGGDVLSLRAFLGINYNVVSFLMS